MERTIPIITLTGRYAAVRYVLLKTGAQRRQWLQSPHKRIVAHFVPFQASWLNTVEISSGILKKKCLNYDHFTSVEMLKEALMIFIDTWSDFYAHTFAWSCTGERAILAPL
jgi:hypothetical protein